jgi:hypothetical protein
MRHVRAALKRMAGLFTGHRADDDVREELQAHLEMETAEYVRRGVSASCRSRGSGAPAISRTWRGESSLPKISDASRCRAP